MNVRRVVSGIEENRVIEEKNLVKRWKEEVISDYDTANGSKYAGE